MTGIHREIPENLMDIVALKKGGAEHLLEKANREILHWFGESKDYPPKVVTYATSIRFAVELFKFAPESSYHKLKERDRRKFTKELKEITEHLTAKPRNVLKLMKALNEILELMLEEGEFFVKEDHTHHGSLHTPAHSVHHRK